MLSQNGISTKYSQWPELNANYTNSKKDVGQDIQSKYQINATNIEVYCILTPQVSDCCYYSEENDNKKNCFRYTK